MPFQTTDQGAAVRILAYDTAAGSFLPLFASNGTLDVTGSGGGGSGGTVTVAGGTLTGITNTVAVAGTVTIANPGSVVSAVSVTNFPSTQTVAGTVTIANPGTTSSTVTIANAVALAAGSAQIGTVALAGGTIAATGTVAVNNFPSTQAISGTLTGITNGVTLAAGPNNVGTVAIAGGALTVGGTTKVVSGSLYNLGGGTTYSNGVVIGSSASPGGNGLVSVTGVFRAGATSGLLQDLMLFTSDAQTTASFNSLIFANGLPTSSTVTDHTTLNVSSADLAKVPKVVPLTSAFPLGTATSFQTLQQTLPVIAPTGTFDIAFVQTGTFASTSTQDLAWALSFLSD
jgi:hypothetical protein